MRRLHLIYDRTKKAMILLQTELTDLLQVGALFVP